MSWQAVIYEEKQKGMHSIFNVELIYATTLLLFLLCPNSYAACGLSLPDGNLPPIDSSKNLHLKTELIDTINGKKDSLYAQLKKQLQKLHDSGNHIEIAEIAQKVASLEREKKTYKKAIRNYDLAIENFLSFNDSAQAIRVMTKKAFVFSAEGNIDSAFIVFVQALEMAKRTEDHYLAAWTNLQLTLWFHQQSDYKEALMYSREVIDYLEPLTDEPLLAEAEYLHGFALMRTGELKKAIGHFNISQNIFKRLYDHDGQARVLNAIADLMAQEQKWLIAFNNYRESIELMTLAQNYKSMYRTYINFAGLLLELKRQPEVLEIFDMEVFNEEYRLVKTYLTIGIFWAKQQRDLEFQVIGYRYLTRIYLTERNYKVGLQYNYSYDSVRELIYNQQRIKVEEAKRLHDNRKKDRVISNLERDKNFSELKEDRNRLTISLLIAVVLIMLIIAVQAYHRNRNRKVVNRQLLRKNVEIEKQKRILLEQNEELLKKNGMIEEQKNALQRAMKDLKNTQTKLVQSERLASIYQLTSGLIHEINNPVNAISGGVQSLTRLINELNSILRLILQLDGRKTIDDIVLKIIEMKDVIFLKEIVGDIQQLIQSISNGTERTHAIINSLKIFNRLDDEKFMKADINGIIGRVIDQFEGCMDKGISFFTELESIPLVQCYPELISMALKNIVANAVLAVGEQDGTITFRTFSEDGFVNVSISDDGCGMNEDILSRVFEPFFSTRSIGQGTGLGLAIAHGIIQKHRGSIKANSAPQKGAEFVIRIPISVD